MQQEEHRMDDTVSEAQPEMRARTPEEHEAVITQLEQIIRARARPAYAMMDDDEAPRKKHQWSYIDKNGRGLYLYPTRMNDAIGLRIAFENQLELYFGNGNIPREFHPASYKDMSDGGCKFNCRTEGVFIVPEALTQDSALMKILLKNSRDIFHDASSHAGRRARG